MHDRRQFLIFSIALSLAFARPASAHPGSGIVVNSQGDVFFVDNSPPPPEGTGKELVWKLDTNGKLTAAANGGGHWLAIDTHGTFAAVDFAKWFQQRLCPNLARVTPADFGPALIAADGQPLVINRDGNLYYARGNLELARLTPDGKTSLLLPGMLTQANQLGGIKGLACGPDGSLYLAYPRAVQKITTDGHASMLVDGIKIEGCTHDVDPEMPGPSLRGLAVTANGTIYAAASGCRRVIKITPDRKVTTLANSSPWIPTGVAVAGDDVYILEFSDAPPTQWRPRVRKVGPDGVARVIGTVER